MQTKIGELVQGMGLNELKLFENELRRDSRKLKRMISDRIERIELEQNKICVVCGHKLEGNESFSLMFDKEGINRKASFCAVDCLSYFLDQLKSIKVQEVKR